MRLLALALFLIVARCVAADPISPAIHREIMAIADREGVPRSVANWLQIEESGDWRTGTWGDPCAINRDEPGGYPSAGLFQPYMLPANINYLLDNYWRPFETEAFNPFDPIHSAKLCLRYLADLHRQLGTWYRATCAYNAGKKNVLSGAVDREARYAKTRAYAMRIVNARAP